MSSTMQPAPVGLPGGAGLGGFPGLEATWRVRNSQVSGVADGFVVVDDVGEGVQAHGLEAGSEKRKIKNHRPWARSRGASVQLGDGAADVEAHALCLFLGGEEGATTSRRLPRGCPGRGRPPRRAACRPRPGWRRAQAAFGAGVSAMASMPLRMRLMATCSIITGSGEHRRQAVGELPRRCPPRAGPASASTRPTASRITPLIVDGFELGLAAAARRHAPAG